MVTTKFWLPWTGSAPAVTPAAEFWTAFATSPSAPVVRPLSTVRSSSDSIVVVGTVAPSGSAKNVLCATYVSDALPAGVVEGDFRFVAAGQGTSTGGVTIQLRARVVNAAGVTQGVLYSGVSNATTSTDPTAENYGLNTTTSTSGARSRRISGTFTPLAVSAGWFLVVEVGMRILTPNGTGRYSNMILGNDSDETPHNYVVDEAPHIGWFEWTAPDPPNVPTGLAQTAKTANSVTVGWVAPAAGTAPTSYEYRVDAGAVHDVGNVLTYTIPSLTANTAYTVEVRSKAAAGTSAWVSVATTTLGPPNVPTGLVSTAHTWTTLDFDWVAPAAGEAVVSYDYRVNGGAPVNVGNVTDHVLTGLAASTAYTFEVRSVNTGGNSAWVSTVGTTSGAPNVPLGLVCVDTTSTTLDFDWSAPVTGDPATSYDYRVDGGAPVSLGNVTDFELTGLTPETEYTFEVRSVNPGGMSAWMSVDATTDGTPPGPPTDLVGTGATDVTLTFGWGMPATGSAVDSFEYRVDGGAVNDIGLVLSHTFGGLAAGTEYLFEVRAVNAWGASAWETQLGTTDAGAPPELGTLTIEWDKADERYYIHGVDRGVLYIPGKNPVPWNGIIGVDDASDASQTILYRDGKIYMADVEPGDYQGQIRAYFYPDEFSECLGIPEVADGLYVDNQKPKRFGTSYRSLIGSGTAGDMFGYQIHLVYNAVPMIGTRSHKTRTNSPELMEISIDIVATPVKLPGMRPSAHYIIDTRHLTVYTLQTLEALLYGDGVSQGSLPDPTELFDILNFGSAITFVDHGDGTWTASGAYANVHMTGPGTWEILNVNGTDNLDGTYQLEDTL